MGFGALKNIPNMKLAHKLIEKLLHKFDTTSCSLFGVEVSVEVVGKLLGIPSKGKAIPQSISITKSNELGAKYKNKTLSQLGDDIKNMERIDKTFKEAFLLYILGHFLCPIVKNQPSQELYKALTIVSDATQYNWAKYVLDHLIEGIKKFQKGKSTTGCIYLLMVFQLNQIYSLSADGDKTLRHKWTMEEVERAVEEIDEDEEKMDNFRDAKSIQWILQDHEERIARLEATIASSQPHPASPKQDTAYKVRKCLAPESYINDDVIYTYISYLKRTISSEDFLFMDSFFYPKLIEVMKEGSEKNLARKFKKLWKTNIFKYSYMLIPIFEEKHWSLVIICFLAEEEGVSPMLLHLDSYAYHQATKISEPIKWFLKQKWNNLKGESSDFPTVDTKTVEVPQQTNDYDCGLFVMYFMKLFLKQAPKRFKIQNLEMFDKNWFKAEDASGSRSEIFDIMNEELNLEKPQQHNEQHELEKPQQHDASRRIRLKV